MAKGTTLNGNGRANRIQGIGDPSNAGEETIIASAPYTVRFTIKGTAALLFHRYNCDAVQAKSEAAKGSKAKKSDNTESYVWRDDAGQLCLPSEYVRGAIITAAKYKQDPRAPRANAAPLFKAALVPLVELASLGVRDWDYLDRRRVTVSKAAVTRERPAMRAGWEAAFEFECGLAEYVTPDLLQEVLTTAGRLVGVGDFRPTFGRFAVMHFEKLN